MAAQRPVIHRLKIRNYRALHDVEFKELQPFTVLFGPNGSGKSTVFDAFAFLYEAFSDGLKRAWDARGRMNEIRSRGQEGPVEIELSYRDPIDGLLTIYELAVEEDEAGRPVILKEVLRWTRDRGPGRPRTRLNFSRGAGWVRDEEDPAEMPEQLDSPDLLAVSALGQLSRHPRVAALRRFISGWYFSYLSADNTRTTPVSGPAERLSRSGDNLPNVIQYLEEEHPDRAQAIYERLAQWVPRLERLDVDRMADGRLLLRLKDAPFDEPILAKWTSDGTLKLLSYLTVLMDPGAPAIVGIEEPENQLHPKLLYPLAEMCRSASANSQIVVSTHSPQFANALRPEELWLLDRGPDGFTRAIRAADIPEVVAMMETGGELGDLWMEGFFGSGNPLAERAS